MNDDLPLKEEDSTILKPENYYKEAIRDPGKEGRRASKIYFLRTFNNFIKSCLIHNTCKKLRVNNLSVLDLCCGKGGDIDKFFQNRCRLYVGVDMATEALLQGKDRIDKIKREKNKRTECKCYLIEENLSVPNSLDEKIPKYMRFDVVSCQMALHYFFSSEETIRGFMRNVVSRLNDGGFFIATIIDDNTLVKRLRDNPEHMDSLTFGNKYYSVKFFQNFFSLSRPFGIKYGFYLEDSIDRKGIDGSVNYVEEYLIMFKKFEELCKEYGLYLEEKENFLKYYDKLIKDEATYKVFTKFIKGFDVDDYHLQWEICQLYQIIAFRKGTPPDDKKEEEKQQDKSYKNKKDNYHEVFNDFRDKIKDVDKVEMMMMKFD